MSLSEDATTFHDTFNSGSVFETTIRYLGGIVSAYQLSGETDYALLEKATEVADKLSFAWKGVSEYEDDTDCLWRSISQNL